MKAAVTVKENYEFRRIYRKGKSLVTPQMVLYLSLIHISEPTRPY